MATNRPLLGLTLHSNLARHYAAADSDIGHAEMMQGRYEHAMGVQAENEALINDALSHGRYTPEQGD